MAGAGPRADAAAPATGPGGRCRARQRRHRPGWHWPALTALLLAMAGQVRADAPAAASEDDDLARIPAAAAGPPADGMPTVSGAGVDASAPAAGAPARAAAPQRLHLENVYTAWSNRARLAVPTGSRSPAHQDRASLDADLAWSPAEDVHLAFSDRLSRYAGDDNPTASSAQWRNDLREAWESWQVRPGRFLQLGRVNLRNGVALGWNPTDFFRARSTVSQASIDPGAVRDNRLGTAMAEAQALAPAATVTLALAPAISGRAPLVATGRENGFDAGWGRTNGEDRALLSLAIPASPFNPQLLAFRDGLGSHWGFDASRVVAASTVAWVEWAGARSPLLSTQAVRFAQATGTLPAGIAPSPQTDTGSAFRQELAAGASWTSSDNLTLTLEYHHNDAGFTPGDFDRWTAAGATGARQAQLAWLVRAYAADRQDPLMRSQWFLRLDWQDVIPSTLNLGALAFVQPHQGSCLVQLSAQWLASRQWTFGGYAQFASGPPASEYGSLPARASVAMQGAFYF